MGCAARGAQPAARSVGAADPADRHAVVRRRDRHARRHAEARDREPARARAGSSSTSSPRSSRCGKRTTTGCPQIDLGALRRPRSARTRPTAARCASTAAPTRPPTSVFVNFTWTPLQRATRAAAEIERTRPGRGRPPRPDAAGHLGRGARAVRNAGRRRAPGARGGEVPRAVDEEPRDRAAQVPLRPVVELRRRAAPGRARAGAARRGRPRCSATRRRPRRCCARPAACSRSATSP